MSDVKVEERDITIVKIAVGMMAVNLLLLVTVVIIFLGQVHKADIVYSVECTYRENLYQQIVAGQNYLMEHPKGAPSLGLSAIQITQTIARERDAFDSLAALNCP